MATAGSFLLQQGAPATLTNPASGYSIFGVDSSNHGYTLNNAGNIWIPNLNASITASSAAIANTDTLVKTLAIPVGLAQTGLSIFINGHASMVAGAAAASVFTLRAGTAGTTGDAGIGALTLPVSGTTGTTLFYYTILATLQSTGASGQVRSVLSIVNASATTGIVPTATAVVQALTTNFNTTTTTNISLTYISGNASNNCTFLTTNISVEAV